MNFIGIDDDKFQRGNVPMTKEEVRILTICKARIAPTDVVWDIGAGTGSLSIEAARQAMQGEVWAVEKNSEAIALIEENAKKFKVQNVYIVSAEAPDGLEELPHCDVVLIGGSGGNMNVILDLVTKKLRLGGRIVLNAITLQSVMEAVAYFRKHEKVYNYASFQVQVSRLAQIGRYDMAKALNPVFIVTAEKKVDE